jgi:hypothetical protein
MSWIWILAAVLVLAVGLRYRHRLGARAKNTRTDMAEANRAEEEFWAETWDEPEEYRP